MKDGTRKGSLLSPHLFARYIRGLIFAVFNSHNERIIGGVFYILAYADDLVLLAPYWFALQKLIKLLQLEGDKIDISCNIKKQIVTLSFLL